MDATCWSQATDEIREISRMSRILLEEIDGIIVEAVDFRAIRTPAEWNRKGRESILANMEKMSSADLEDLYTFVEDCSDSGEYGCC